MPRSLAWHQQLYEFRFPAIGVCPVIQQFTHCMLHAAVCTYDFSDLSYRPSNWYMFLKFEMLICSSRFSPLNLLKIFITNILEPTTTYSSYSRNMKDQKNSKPFFHPRNMDNKREQEVSLLPYPMIIFISLSVHTTRLKNYTLNFSNL